MDTVTNSLDKYVIYTNIALNLKVNCTKNVFFKIILMLEDFMIV